MVIKCLAYLPISIHNIFWNWFHLCEYNDGKGNWWSIILRLVGSAYVTVQKAIKLWLVQKLFWEKTSLFKPLHYCSLFPYLFGIGFDLPFRKYGMWLCSSWTVWSIHFISHSSTTILLQRSSNNKHGIYDGIFGNRISLQDGFLLRKCLIHNKLLTTIYLSRSLTVTFDKRDIHDFIDSSKTEKRQNKWVSKKWGCKFWLIVKKITLETNVSSQHNSNGLKCNKLKQDKVEIKRLIRWLIIKNFRIFIIETITQINIQTIHFIRESSLTNIIIEPRIWLDMK